MERHASNYAWAGLAAGIIIYEYYCPDGETLSEGFDRFLKHPVGKLAAIGSVALVGAHLLNIYEHFDLEQLDPIHRLADTFRK